MNKDEFLDFMRDKSRAMILTPEQWPVWPLLTMKRIDPLRYNDADYLALLFDVEDQSCPILYIGNLLMVARTEGKTWAETLAPFIKRQYELLDALLLEYRVDDAAEDAEADEG